MEWLGWWEEIALVELGEFLLPKCEGGLGFRNIHTFNLALLAKQGWHLIYDLNSLMAKVFKAKYHPLFSFLKASVNPNGSYYWKSLCAVRTVLTRGSRWQVGSGELIRIWEDRWIPMPSTFCIFLLSWLVVIWFLSRSWSRKTLVVRICLSFSRFVRRMRLTASVHYLSVPAVPLTA